MPPTSLPTAGFDPVTPTPDPARLPTDAAGSTHLLQLGGLPPAAVRRLLERTRRVHTLMGETASLPLSGPAQAPAGLRGLLKGRVVANLFFEDSTRTRVSFSVAARGLGAKVIDLTSVGSSVSKGESVADTAANVAAMGADALVIRHRASGACHLVARTLAALRPGRHFPAGRRCAVINAGDGRHEHPTQGLLDTYTLAEAHGRLDGFDLSGLTVAIVGDVAASRVARSDIAAMTALGARVVCVGPPSLVPASLGALGCALSNDLDAVLPDADAVNVLRIQFERREPPAGATHTPGPAAVISLGEYARLYALDADRLRTMKPGAIVMHPGPINRGVEITPEAADSPRSVVLRQVAHGVLVRMAVACECLGVSDF
ncbi:MAG: aspartate carbamoyltransferase [Planctomyces sp.]|nr:aspartate carbamoyltransferase [Planctomyces sp.]